jgi:hypothetical protein
MSSMTVGDQSPLTSAGHKWWRFKYRFGGRADGKPGKAEKVLALGVYPEVSLKRASEKRDEARRLLADGIDPSAERKTAAETQRVAHLGTFEAVAREWLKRRAGARATARRTSAG